MASVRSRASGSERGEAGQCERPGMRRSPAGFARLMPAVVIALALAVCPCTSIAAVKSFQPQEVDVTSAGPAIVMGSNGLVRFSLKLPPTGQIDGKPYKGFRLYREKWGTEISFRQPSEVLVEDLKNRTEAADDGLQNGELYVYRLKAYDGNGREFRETTIFGLPGTSSTGGPHTPRDCYGIDGDGAAALYWEKNLEADLKGYEVYRKSEGSMGYRLIARVPKLFRAQVGTHSTSSKGDTFIQGLTPPGYVDRKVFNGISYTYQVRAYDANGSFSDFTEPVTITPKSATLPTSDEVVLIVNDGVDGSLEVAQHYVKMRHIPDGHIFHYWHNPKTYATDYAREIQYPLQRFLLKHKLAGKVRYLVPCYGVPIAAMGRALDSKLTDLFDRYTFGHLMGAPNPYYNSNRHFDGTTGTYLVTRLDGPTVEIAKSLVDKAVLAEQHVTAKSGTAYFGNRGGTTTGDRSIGSAAKIGKEMGVRVVNRTGVFGEHELGSDAYWYFAWYHGYRDPVKGMWPVGAVGSHLISNSFATLHATDPAKTSWVQGVLEKGITATFGAVVEPYEQGYTRPDIFFEHFWSGDYNFAESFAMATPTIQWAMSAVGDPLYRLKK